jgi:hypothetical protein
MQKDTRNRTSNYLLGAALFLAAAVAAVAFLI